MMLVIGIAFMLADAFAHDALQKLTRFAHPLASYGLLLALLALGILQVDKMLSIIFDKNITQDVVYGILILALSIGSLAVCGRDNGSLRSIAYAAFSFEVLYLAFSTVGSMIGTSGFFLTAACWCCSLQPSCDVWRAGSGESAKWRQSHELIQE
ncbi:hypothetical protein AB664_06130 [Brucella anthropi]|uniref:Uncharacterized protein n=1 Tax=Brucella anthropi TaxID=529 RepID=A0A656Z5R9_BRUAN|nr:hypothetical protein AB664_06130 [Brucella anthropi]